MSALWGNVHNQSNISAHHFYPELLYLFKYIYQISPLNSESEFIKLKHIFTTCQINSLKGKKLKLCLTFLQPSVFVMAVILTLFYL